MKTKNLLIVITIIVALFLLIKVIPFSKKPYYKPKKYSRTVEDKIDGVVTRIVEGKNLFGIVINNNEKVIYPFTYMIEKMPENWKATYPEDFIQIGDSIYKDAKSDTFYLIRGNSKWEYALPN